MISGRTKPSSSFDDLHHQRFPQGTIIFIPESGSILSMLSLRHDRDDTPSRSQTTSPPSHWLVEPWTSAIIRIAIILHRMWWSPSHPCPASQPSPGSIDVTVSPVPECDAHRRAHLHHSGRHSDQVLNPRVGLWDLVSSSSPSIHPRNPTSIVLDP